MRWASSLLLGGLLLLKAGTQAAPLDDNAVSVSKVSPRADYPNDYPYPTKDDCSAKVKTEKDKSLFYTGLGGFGLTGKQLQDYKRQKKLHLVGDSYTYGGGFVAPRNEPKDDLDKQTEYFGRFADEFSEAFAEKSSGEVFLLLDWDTDANNPPNSACQTTWYRKEYPALQANSAVTKVTQVNPKDFTQTKQIWPTSGNGKLLRRAVDLCLDWDAGKAPDLKAPPTGDDDDSGSTSQPPPPDYAPGTCSFHLDEWENCDAEDKNLFAIITMYDNNKAVIGQTTVDENKNPLGDPINNANPLNFQSKLPHPLRVTGEHQNDYVQFDYGDLHWQSRIPNGGASCSVGGWDPRDGPICDLFGDQYAVSISIFDFFRPNSSHPLS